MEDAITWMKNTKSGGSMLVLIHRGEDDRIDKAYTVHDSTWIEIPLALRHPKVGEETNLYTGCHSGTTERLAPTLTKRT